MDRPARLRSLLSTVLTGAEPGERLSALASLRQELDTAETELAAEALHAGLSWSQIGAALGVSKQAAHRRHSHGVALLDQAAETRHRGSRAIVSSEARRAVRIARAEAAAVGEGKVGTEHLLLGLLQCGDVKTVQVLERLGVTVSLARQAAQPTVEVKPHEAGFAAGGGNGEVVGDVPPDLSPLAENRVRPSAVVSPLARRVLERALTPASGEPGTLTALDLLQALLRYDNGGATRTLAALGVEAQQVQDEIARLDELSQTPSAYRVRRGAQRQARSRPV
jgi:Clp amino terminal domain, pathogenicity island component